LRSFPAHLAAACVALTSVLPHAAFAQEPDARATLEDTLAKAKACQIAFGEAWDPIVEDGLFNLESYLIEQDPTIPKVELDVILAEVLADGEALPATDELREHCNNVMAYGG